MKSIITITTALTLCLLTSFYAQAQETDTQTSVEQLSILKENIVQEEKDALKAEVENINARLQTKAITDLEADVLKQEAAEKHALNIENRVAIVDNKIALAERNGNSKDENAGFVITIGTGKDNDNVVYIGAKNKKRKYDRRTTSGLNLAFGLNNVITEGESFNKSDFEVGGSRFFEIGWTWRPAFLKTAIGLGSNTGCLFSLTVSNQQTIATM